MKIYHIEFAKAGTKLSGGEVCMLELIKHFSDKGHENILLTTDNGKATYQNELPANTNIKYITINSYENEIKYGIFISYLLRIPKIKRLIRAMDKAYEDGAVICHSEFFPNSIGMWLFGRRKANVKRTAFYHMKAPGIFRGYEGEFTGKMQMPRPTIIHYYLNQVLYRWLTSKDTTIFTVNSFYEKYLKKVYPKNKVVVLESYGHQVEAMKASIVKKYDVIWVGRFHRQKGLPDFIDILLKLKDVRPSFKAVVLGGGDENLEKEFRREIDTKQLSSNVYYPGFVTGKDKMRLYAESKIFLMTSYYESFGQVIVEAASLGLPVVAYDLPVYDTFGDGIVREKILDQNAMVHDVVELLNNSKEYNIQKNKGLRMAQKRSWSATGDCILQEII